MPVVQPIVHSFFKGMKPRSHPLRLAPGEAQEAVNCDFLGKTLRPLRHSKKALPEGQGTKPLAGGFIVGPDTRKAEARAAGDPAYLPITEIAGSTKWLYKEGSKGIAEEIADRTIFSGAEAAEVGGAAAQSAQPMFMSGSDMYKFATWCAVRKLEENIADNDPDLNDEQKANFRLLGITRSGTDSSDDPLTYTYAFTVVNEYGDETGLSRSVSEECKAADTVHLKISSEDLKKLNDEYSGYGSKLYIRIYRVSGFSPDYLRISKSATDYTDYELEADADLDIDDKLDETVTDLKYAFPTQETCLTESTRNFIQHPNGFIAAHDDKTLYMSDPLAVGKFPESYRLSFSKDIADIAELNGRILVFFGNAEHRVVEVESPIRSTVRSPQVAYNCLRNARVETVATGVLYPSSQGIAMTTGYQTTLLTADHLDPASMSRLFNPEKKVSIFGGEDSFLVTNNDKEAYLFQRMQYMTKLSEKVLDARYIDSKWIFLTEDTNSGIKDIVDAFGTIQPRTMKWVSGMTRMAEPATMRSLKVVGSFVNAREGVVGGLGSREGLGFSGGLGNPLIRVASYNDAQKADVTIRMVRAGTMAEERLTGISEARTYNFSNDRQVQDYGIEIETNAEIQQLALGTSQRSLAYVPLPA